jgi:ATP:ADP antiporter, AAA family
VSPAARAYLEAGGARITGQLNDSLADQALDFSIRRRIPRLLARLPSQLSADGLVQGLHDTRFEIRYQCGRALDYMKRHYPDIHYSPEALMDVVRRELSVGIHIWRSRRVIESGDPAEADRLLDEGAGTDRNLEHVFSLLAVILAREPVIAAYHGLYQPDRTFRALALEYLENILPQDVRERLWTLIEEAPVSTGTDARQLETELLRASATLKFARVRGSETHAAVLAAQERGEPEPDHSQHHIEPGKAH